MTVWRLTPATLAADLIEAPSTSIRRICLRFFWGRRFTHGFYRTDVRGETCYCSSIWPVATLTAVDAHALALRGPFWPCRHQAILM